MALLLNASAPMFLIPRTDTSCFSPLECRQTLGSCMTFGKLDSQRTGVVVGDVWLMSPPSEDGTTLRLSSLPPAPAPAPGQCLWSPQGPDWPFQDPRGARLGSPCVSLPFPAGRLWEDPE